MASEVDIYNLALGYIGISHQVEDPNERSEPARQCRRFFSQVRDEVLRSFPWTCARRAKQLAEREEEFPGWTYCYDYPTDCIFALAVMPESGLRYPIRWIDLWHDVRNGTQQYQPRVAWERALREDGQGQIILTDLTDAWLLYIARVTTTTMFDAGLVNAMAWNLGSKIALPLKASVAVARNAQDNYEAMRGRAAGDDFNEGYPDAEPDAPSISARG